MQIYLYQEAKFDDNEIELNLESLSNNSNSQKSRTSSESSDYVILNL
jgi:hypothetical protein